ncbi:hypothetical protein [Actinosynnema sp. NPDC023587]|uniref:hypothetical protein n=1 Tax=Actinosynnema sp. NPDC023587 TaxID=3154695 RepID=UPI00340AAA73
MPHTIRLRIDTFTKAARLAGFRSDYALAKAMDVNRSTVARLVSGELQPGPAFIGGALTALTPLQFDDLFEVVPVSTHEGQPEERMTEQTAPTMPAPSWSAEKFARLMLACADRADVISLEGDFHLHAQSAESARQLFEISSRSEGVRRVHVVWLNTATMEA